MRNNIFLIMTVITFLFASCSNFFEDSISKIEEDSASSESTKAGGESVKYVNVTGSINLEGAVPSAIRTAFPANPNILSLTLTVRAVNKTDSSDTVTGEIVSGSNNSSYRISIPAGSTAKTYEIQIDAANSLGTVLSGKSQAFTISQASPTTEQNIILRAIQTEGTGTFSLRVGISTGLGIQSAKVIYNPDPEHTSSIATAKASNICKFAQGTINGTSITNGLACGSYLMTFEFYSGALDANHHVTGDLLYSFKQTVNIFKGLETNSWVKNGAEPYLTVSETSTQCIITATLIDEFTLTEIFVDSSLQNTDSTAAGYTSESGTFLNPCRTLSAAISKLNHADKDYKIYIKGSLSGAQIIPETLTDTSEGTYHAKSLTLIGYNGLDDSGIPQDSLDGGFTSPTSDGVTLKINSSVPVIIKNLKITGGNNAGDGGGINSKGNLTLDSGALVCRNTAVCGGGVMNSGGELTIKSGAVIANNTAYNTASDTNFTYGGGGVYNYNGKLVMSGGQIKANTTNQCGGGIYNHMDDKDKITELYIYGDAVIGGDTDADGNKANTTQDSYGGGGIYNRGGLVYFGCTAYSAAGGYEPEASNLVEWTGKISHNTSGAWGGGYLNASTSASTSTWSVAEQIKSSGITHMLSGQISANTAVTGGGIAVHNGSLFTIHGGVIGGSSSSDGNTASQMGGGIYSMAKVNIYDATISNNSAPQGGGFFSVQQFNIRGNAYIPYGIAGVEGAGKNDIYLMSGKKIIITGKLTPPAECTDGIIAAITMSTYNGGDTLIEVATDASPATNVADESVRFKLTESGWKIFDNGKIGQQVFYIAAENSNDGYIGSDAKPLASFASLVSKIKTQSAALDRKIICEIIVKGDVESPNANFDFDADVADSILLRGYNDSPTVVNNAGTITGITDKMNAKGSNTVLTINTDVPVTIRNLLITGAGGDDHHGIYMSKGTLVLESGACISGNTAHVHINGGWGGGIYLGAAQITMKSGAYITGNLADGLGGGVAVGGTFILDGGEISYNAQELHTGGGGGVYVNHGAHFWCNSGCIKNNRLNILTGDAGGSGILRQYEDTDCSFAGEPAVFIYDNYPPEIQYGSRRY